MLAIDAGSGATRFAKQLGGPEHDNPNDLATDSEGNVYFAGDFTGALVVDGNVLRSNDLAYRDSFVASYTGTGVYRWAFRHGGKVNDFVPTVTVGTRNDVWFTYTYIGPHVVGGRDAYVGVFDSEDGTPKWESAVRGVGWDTILASTTDSLGNIYFAGLFEAEVDFGSGVPVSTLNRSLFLLKLEGGY